MTDTDIKKPITTNGDAGRAESGEHTADQVLVSLGYTPELQRNRSTLQVAFMSFVLRLELDMPESRY